MSIFSILYRGAIYEIWIAKQQSGCQVMEYGRSLDPIVHRRLRNILEKTANEGKYTNEEIYRHIGESIYEFKFRRARIYSFDDDRRIVLTHGGDRPNSVVSDRRRAVRVRDDYQEWKDPK